jgi:hypothetical protein
LLYLAAGGLTGTFGAVTARANARECRANPAHHDISDAPEVTKEEENG